MAKKWSPSNHVYVMEILQEAFKLPQRNKNTFFFIFLFTTIFHILLSLAHKFSLVSLSTKLAPDALALQSTDPEIQLYHLKSFLLIIFVEMTFLFLMACVSLFSVMATIHASSMSYSRKEKDLTLKKVCLRMNKIWFKPTITCFYFSIINAGYIGFAFVALGIWFFLGRSAVELVVVVPAIFFYVYLVLVWMMSLVVSVLEDSCYGIEAIGRAEKLVKGRKAVGMILTCILIMVLGASFYDFHLPPNIGKFIAWVTMNFAILMSMTAYTVFFLERKQSYGERIKVEEDLRDNKLLEVGGIHRRKTCNSSQTDMGVDFLHEADKTSFI